MFRKRKDVKDLKKEYDLPLYKVKKIKSKKGFIRFQAVWCWKCKTGYNIPIFQDSKRWVCAVCGEDNLIDHVHVFLPMENPDLGPSKTRINQNNVSQEPDDDFEDAPWRIYPYY